MKTNRIIFAMIMTMIIACHCYAQGVTGHIDSVKMVPAAPTSNDTIIIIAYNSFSSGGCSDKRQHYLENLPYIQNTTQYCIGMLPLICHNNDTVRISPLSPGLYYFHYRLEAEFSFNGCDPYNPADSVTFQFIVTFPAIIGNMTDANRMFKIIYDAGYGRLMINLNQEPENCKAVLQDILGKEIYRCRLYHSMNEISLNVEDGIYLVTVFNDRIKQTQKVVIRNDP